MRRELFSLILRGLAYAVPVLALVILGFAWLVEHRQWIPFGLATAVIVGFLLGLSRWLARASQQRYTPTPAPVTTWPDAGQQAWAEVDRFAASVEAAPPPIDDLAAHQGIFLDVLNLVGKHFHPKSKHPAMELTVSQVLEISERTLRDLRRGVIDLIPLARNLKLKHIRGLHRAMDYGPAALSAGRLAVFAFRVRRWLYYPQVALAQEVVNRLDMSPSKLASRQAARIGAGLVVRQVGAYAIQAFSGQASLDITTLSTVSDNAPLRVLLLGPINAGKSSLLNAMFGQDRSRGDILPCPGVKGEHLLDREGAPRAVVLDSDGFGGADDETTRKRLFEEIESIDLIIAVTAANGAARKLECEVLDEVRRRYAASTRRCCPPIVVAATHIDKVSPAREWKPPYDFVDGESPKELNVRDAIDAISEDFQILIERVIPVCLAPGAAYNVDEGLLPAIGAALPEINRAKFLRLVERNRSVDQSQRTSERIDRLLKIAGRIAGIPPTSGLLVAGELLGQAT